MPKLLFCAGLLIFSISAIAPGKADEVIDVTMEGRYYLSAGVSAELAEEMAFYIAKKKAVNLGGRYFAHHHLIETYERNKDEIYSLATNQIEAEILTRQRSTEGQKTVCIVRISARIRASDFVKASLEDARQDKKEARAPFRVEMEQPVPADIDPGRDISHAYRLLRERQWRMALIYLNHLDKKYPNWAEIHMAKALVYYIHHKPAAMEEALDEACRLDNRTACEDLANIKKVHEYDFGVSIFDE